MSIANNYEAILKTIPEGVKLVAVSKTQTCEIIMEAYNAGYRIFGENKAQELESKHNELPKDIEWHMIGHLQTNKVKYIASFVSLIHSVDSLKLLSTIDKEARKHNRTIDCLLEIHIAKEETKFGLTEEKVIELLDSWEYKEMKNIRIVGLMGMATYSNNESAVKSEYKYLKDFYYFLKKEYFHYNTSFKELSMGMSGDYKIALEEGSTIIRIGYSIFGKRNYQHDIASSFDGNTN